MSKSKEKSGKLFLLISLMLAFTVLVLNLTQAFVVSSISRKNISLQSKLQYETLCKQTADGYSNIIKEYIAHMRFYSNSDVVRANGTSEQIVQWLRSESVVKVRNSAFAYVAWVKDNGDSFIDIKNGSNVATRDYHKAIMAGADYFIDNPVIAKATGKLSVHVCTAVKQNNKTVGLFYGTIDPTTLSTNLKTLDLGKMGFAAIYGGNGELIGTTTDDAAIKEKISALKENDSETYAEIEKAWTGKSKYTGEVNLDTGKTLIISEPIECTDWKLILFLNEANIFETATLVTKTLGISTVLSILFISFIAGIFIFIIIKPLSVVESAIRGIATGDADLTKRINIKSNNEIGRVVNGFNTFAEKLQTIISTMKTSKEQLLDAGSLLKDSTQDTSSAITEIIGNIESMSHQVDMQKDSVHQTAGAVNEIASNIESLNRMIETQSESVNQASNAVGHMIDNIQSVNTSVKKMADSFTTLEDKAVIGVKTQNEVNDMIVEIEQESEALQEANTIISGIAEQTNLLAMNAAIEAAHAGDAGKGFSVVADEIRKLSEDSSNQSRTIGEQMSKISETIQKIVQTSQSATKAFNDVSEGINSTDGLVKEISNAMTEQTEGSKQITKALDGMTDATKEVKVASLEMAEGNKAILKEVNNLQDATFQIKDGMEEMTVGARKINETGAALSELAQRMDESIKDIGNQVDQFKV